MGEGPKSDRELFNAALEVSDAEERTAFLDRECAGDEARRQRVDSLLEAFEQAEGFMDSTRADRDGKARKWTTTQVIARPREGPGAVIGNFKLLQEIGEGGFGVVYMAEQLQPIRRKVALKIIKPGMDTREVVARFEAERQALALMSHPHIAQVFDGGTTESGRPYFVMELVRGVPITEFCNKSRLSTESRLSLFLDVCGAIQHAHLKGIIHRDIKPSNILITLHDGHPVAKVIDFGIAKALNQELTEKTLFTAYGQMIGTPQYTSPEQAEMSGLDIDTRSDIYSLGVLLYELLTGETPITKKELTSAGVNEIHRLILDKEPTRPSLLVSQICSESTTLAESRRAEPSILISQIKGDLDWIVLKALEKDRNRRYETASSFAQDVRCYLDHQPVSASPPTLGYMLGKFAGRHKPLLAGVATLFVILLLSAVGMSLLYLEARKGKRAAENLARIAQEERANAEAARKAETEQRNRALEAANQLKQNLARADFEASTIWLEKWEHRKALAHLARSLRTNPDYPPTAPLTVSLLRDLNHDLKPGMILSGDTPIRGLALNSLEDRLLGMDTLGKAWLWDAQTGELLYQFGTEEPVAKTRFSADGRHLVLLGSNGVAQVWTVRNPVTRLCRISTPSGITEFRMANRRTGDLILATASRNGDVQAWEAASGKLLLAPSTAGDASLPSNLELDGEARVVGARSKRLWRFQSLDPANPPAVEIPAVSNGFEHFSRKHGLLIQYIAASDEICGWEVATGKKAFSLPAEGHFFQAPKTLAEGQRMVCFSNRKVAGRVRRQVPFPGVMTLAFELPSGRLLSRFLEPGVARWPNVDEAGQHCLAQIGDRKLLLIDLASGKHIRSWKLSQPLDADRSDSPTVFSASGRRLALIFNDHVALHDSDTGQELCRLPRTPIEAIRVGFSPSGLRMATSTRDGNLRVWDTDSGEQLAGPLKHAAFVSPILWNQAETRLISGDYYGTVRGPAHGSIRVWNVEPNRARHELDGLPSTAVQGTWGPSGRWIAVALGESGVALVNRETGQADARASLDGRACYFVAISPTGDKVAALSPTSLHLWRWRPDRVLVPLALAEDSSELEMVRFSPDGRWLATKSKDKTVRIWDAGTGKPLTPALPHAVRIHDIAFRPGQPELLVMTRNDLTLLRLHNLPGKPESIRIDKGRSRWTAHFSRDGKAILGSSLTKAILWDANTGEALWELPHESSIRATAISPDGGRIATAIPNSLTSRPVPGRAMIWDFPEKSFIADLPHPDQITDLEFSPDGRNLATSCLDGRLRIWDVETGKPVSVALSHSDRDGYSFEFNPKGGEILTVTGGRVRIFPLPFPKGPPPGWLADLAEAVARFRLNDRGALVPVDSFSSLQVQLSKQTSTNAYDAFGRWFMARPADRGPTP